jgi:hypothetical protein
MARLWEQQVRPQQVGAPGPDFRTRDTTKHNQLIHRPVLAALRNTNISPLGFVLSRVPESAHGAPVIFQKVVHSIRTGEAVCDEQAVTRERANGLSQECPIDGDQCFDHISAVHSALRTVTIGAPREANSGWGAEWLRRLG